MESVLVPIAVAVIGGPIMWLLSRLDRNNTKQHDYNMKILSRVESKVDRLDEKSDHLDTKIIHIDQKVADVHERVHHVHERVSNLETGTKKTKQASSPE